MKICKKHQAFQAIG